MNNLPSFGSLSPITKIMTILVVPFLKGIKGVSVQQRSWWEEIMDIRGNEELNIEVVQAIEKRSVLRWQMKDV